MSEARKCTWCKEKFELVLKGGHLTCPECHHFVVKRGEPDWDEGFGTRIGADEYWMGPYYGAPLDDGNPLKVLP